MWTHSITVHVVLYAKRDELRNRRQALILKNQGTSGLTEEAKLLLAKFVNTENTKDLAKVTAEKGRDEQRPPLAENCVNTFETRLKKVQDVLKQRVGTTKEYKRRATDVAAQLARSL